MNNVWILTWGHPVFIYDRANDNFRHAFSGKYREVQARDIISDSEKYTWISLDSALLRYDPETEESTTFRIIPDKSVKSEDILAYPYISFDNTGQLWLFYNDNADYRIYKGIISREMVSPEIIPL